MERRPLEKTLTKNQWSEWLKRVKNLNTEKIQTYFMDLNNSNANVSGFFFLTNNLHSIFIK